jgi:hypothetical protein
MLGLVSGKGDAHAERQSSWPSSLRVVRERLAVSIRLLELSFAGFVFLHFAGQAYSAYTDGALPESSFEQAPWFVGALRLLLWLPFAVFGVRQLSRSFSRGRLPSASGQKRALAAVEPLSLAIVVLFGTVHGLQMAWPTLSGSLDAGELRAELVADLSSTWRGWPLQSIFYLCAVGAASFCAARLTLARLSPARPALSRAVVSLAVLGCLLGSYAVIRCGSGSLLP